jgi:uncharacterized repeat protein (TIGR01451 family)
MKPTQDTQVKTWICDAQPGMNSSASQYSPAIQDFDINIQHRTQPRTFQSLIPLALLATAFGIAPQSQAQTATQNLSLPLVSVGSNVGWKLEPEDYRLFVPRVAAGRSTQLEVYSPDVNLQDYANKRNRDSYYGDELYGKGSQLATFFKLTDASGKNLAENRFSTATEHRTAALFQGTLEPGIYGLSVSSIGNGKNSFQLRASNGMRVEASRFTVNVRGRYGQDQLVGFLDLGQAALGKTVKLENYDADGQKEMQVTLVDPNGKRRNLTVSEDTKWAGDEIKVTPENVGSWKVLVRVLPTTKQFSNSVAFRFNLEGNPLFARLPGFGGPRVPEVAPKPEPKPIPEVKPVAKGTLEVNANAELCGEVASLAPRFSIAGIAYAQPGRISLTPGEYTIDPAKLEGASAANVKTQIKDGMLSAETLAYTVKPMLELEPKQLELEVGQTATVRFRVSSAFERALIARLKVQLPDGLVAAGAVTRTGLVGDRKQVELSVPVRATRAGNSKIIAKLEPNCASLEVPVRVLESAKLALEKTVDHENVAPGDRVTFTIKASNTGTVSAREIRLIDVLPVGLEGKNLAESFTLEAGGSRSFKLDAVVIAKTNMQIINTAKLEWKDQTLRSSATVNAKVPVAVAKLMLEKTVNKNLVKPGETVEFVITASNVGGTAVQSAHVTDVIPAGLTGKNLDETLSLEPGAKKQFTVPATVNSDAQGKIINTAKLEGNNQQLEASASVRVESLPPVEIPQGMLRVNAFASLCQTRVPLNDASAVLNGQAVLPSGLKIAPGGYTLEPVAVAGATAQAVQVSISKNETTQATLEYAIQTKLALEPEKLEMQIGETRTITARLTTEFARAIPVSLRLELPAGVKALGPVTATGEASSGKPFELNVQVRAMQTVKDGTVRAMLDNDCAVSTSSLNVFENVLPTASRESRVVVLARTYEVPAGAKLVLSDRIPEGATYISGSSGIVRDPSFLERSPNGVADLALPDPFVSGDRLFWVLPNATGVQGVIYRLAHSAVLVMPADRVGAVLVLPSRAASAAREGVRLELSSPLGQLLGAGELRLLEGDPKLLTLLREARPVVDQRPVGGPAKTIRVSGERISNDSSDAPVLVIEALDAQGNPANDEFVTLELSADPITPDAVPELPGYQAKLERGVARVRLGTLGRLGDVIAPNDLVVAARISNTNGTISANERFSVDAFKPNLEPNTLPVNATNRPWVAAGLVRLQANFTIAGTPAFTFLGGARAFARGELGNDLLLTAAINQQATFEPGSGTPWVLGGNLSPPSNPFDRFPLFGDASTNGTDVRSSDGFYVRLESGPSYAMYGQVTPAFTGQLAAYSPNFNGAQGLLRAAGFTGNGFVALVPNADQRAKLRGDGTSLYLLPNAPIKASSERLVIVSYDANDANLKRSSRQLTRLVDYTLDEVSGTIQLARPLSSLDANGGPQFLEVEFASESGSAPRELRAGLQGAIGGESGFQLVGTVLAYDLDATPSALFGLAANYRSEHLQFGLETAWSGAFGTGGGLGLAAQGAYTNGGFQARLQYRETWLGFIAPDSNSAQSGRSLNLSSSLALTSSLSLDANVSHSQEFVLGAASTSTSLQARNNFGFLSVSLGVAGAFKNTASPDGFLTAGLELPIGTFKITALQRVPFTASTYGDTTLSLEYAPVPTFGLRLSDRLTYVPNGIRQDLSLGVRGGFSNSELLRVATGNTPTSSEAFGSTNLSASYDLVSTSGDAGRTRLNLDTSIPLGSNWSAQLGGEALFQPANPFTTNANVGLLYSAETLKGSARAQFSLQPSGIKQVYTASVVGQLGPDLVISPSLEYGVLPSFTTLTNGSSVRDGGRFSIAAAWRAGQFNLLTNHTGRFGFYAPNGDTLEGEVQASYQASERFYLRPGAAYKLERNVITAQLGLAATYYFTDQFGLGGNVLYALQPSTGASKIAFGLEASLRVLDGLTFAAGFNLLGFNDFGGFNAAPGFYVRFDWAFDERLWTGK